MNSLGLEGSELKLIALTDALLKSQISLAQLPFFQIELAQKIQQRVRSSSA